MKSKTASELRIKMSTIEMHCFFIIRYGTAPSCVLYEKVSCIRQSAAPVKLDTIIRCVSSFFHFHSLLLLFFRPSVSMLPTEFKNWKYKMGTTLNLYYQRPTVMQLYGVETLHQNWNLLIKKYYYYYYYYYVVKVFGLEEASPRALIIQLLATGKHFV